MDEKAVMVAMKSKDGASVLFEKISDYVREVTDSDGEMRGINSSLIKWKYAERLYKAKWWSSFVFDE